MEKQDVKRQLIETVKDLYSKEDYAAISLSRILSQAQVSKGGLYWYFDSKEALFEAAFEACCDEAVEATYGFDREGLSCVAVLKERIYALIRLNNKDPRPLAVISAHLRHLCQKTGESLYPYGPFLEDVTALVKEGMATGEFAPLPQEFIVELVFLFNARIVDYFGRHPEEYTPKKAKELVDRLFLALEK